MVEPLPIKPFTPEALPSYAASLAAVRANAAASSRGPRKARKESDRARYEYNFRWLGMPIERPLFEHLIVVGGGPVGIELAQAHLRHLNPFPKDLGEVLRRYDKVLVPEMNLGQLSLLLRGKYLVDAVGYNQVRGLPFKAKETGPTSARTARSRSTRASRRSCLRAAWRLHQRSSARLPYRA